MTPPDPVGRPKPSHNRDPAVKLAKEITSLRRRVRALELRRDLVGGSGGGGSLPWAESLALSGGNSFTGSTFQRIVYDFGGSDTASLYNRTLGIFDVPGTYLIHAELTYSFNLSQGPGNVNFGFDSCDPTTGAVGGTLSQIKDYADVDSVGFGVTHHDIITIDGVDILAVGVFIAADRDGGIAPSVLTAVKLA